MRAICKEISNLLKLVSTSNTHQLCRSGNVLYISTQNGCDKKTSKKEDDYENDIKERILAASLQHVPSYGWTIKALAEGSRSMGYPGVTSGLFPRGPADLIFHFYASSNRESVAQLKIQHVQNSDLKELEMVEAAIKTRLRLLIPYLEWWPQALSVMSHPRNAPIALSHLLALVDDICYHSGDRSVDFNWYTRRAAICAIYKASEIYLVQDKSEDFVETWNFLKRRINEAVNIESLVKNSSHVNSIAQDTVKATLTTAKNIFRLNYFK